LSPRVLVGCCGFPISKGKYFELMKAVEVQRTFYKVPKVTTARRWRESAPEDFVFTLKAWAAITHPPRSPIWRRAGIECEDCGELRPTEGNFRAWEATLEIARELRAEFVVFQSPPSFSRNEERVKNLSDFFSSIDRAGVRIGWEPRHESWWEGPGELGRLLDSLDLTHVVDPLSRRGEPLDSGPVAYFRLHGRYEGRRIVYNHQYDDDEIGGICRAVERELARRERVYVMFNNGRFMLDDALRFASACGSVEPGSSQSTK